MMADFRNESSVVAAGAVVAVTAVTLLLQVHRRPNLPVHERIIGRPRSGTQLSEILFLRQSLNYSWMKVASILQISRSTLYRRLQEAGINPNDYSTLTDHQIDEIMRSLKKDHPNDGEVLIKAHLLQMGIRISRSKIRQSIHRVDHEGVVRRRSSVIRRRVYSVPYPNYIWHVDGHHKLIRWRFVVHASIDGFSRTITYLRCSDNNRANTVLSLFKQAVSNFGLPGHVRSDHGGENVDVWRYMLSSHSFDYSCIITGSSVHNERIERLWRDVNRCVASVFAENFQSFEDNGVLDPNNEVDLYCLHYIFLGRINKSLSEFMQCWNNHAISSEGSKTPYQLFFEGLNYMAIRNIDHPSTLSLAQIQNLEIHRGNVHAPHRESVVIPRINFIPCATLKHNFNTLDHSNLNENVLYNQAIQIAGDHLLQTCNQCFINY
jgi:uncharacterized protein YneF (UPF0154 family)